MDPFGLFSIMKSLNNFGKWLNSVNDKHIGGKLNKVNDKYIGGKLNKINDKYISPTLYNKVNKYIVPVFKSDGTVKGALKSTAKAVGVGAAAVIIAATSAEVAAGARVIQAVSNVAGPTVTRAVVSAGGRMAAGATAAYGAIAKAVTDVAAKTRDAVYYYANGINHTTQVIYDVYSGTPVSTIEGGIIGILKDHTMPFILRSINNSGPTMSPSIKDKR